MEKIEIKNFVGIKDITLEIKQINILIGPQASGKSIIAKLLYYFKSFIFEIINAAEQSKNKSANGQEVYIELKGSDVKHAVEQLATTIQKLTDDMSVSKLCFVASTRCPITSTQIQKFKKEFMQKYKANLTIKNGEIVHKV